MRSWEDVKRGYVIELMTTAKGNLSTAAALSGVTSKTLRRWIKSFDLYGHLQLARLPEREDATLPVPMSQPRFPIRHN